MREELIEMEEPGLYDEFVRGLKGEVLGEVLGGDRREMWAEVRRNRLGLVEGKESERSKVGEEEARKFLMGR